LRCAIDWTRLDATARDTVEFVNADSIRTVNPASRPQFPYDGLPPRGEASKIRYAIHAQTSEHVRMRDGVELAYDVYRPAAPGQQFPVLLSWSPYTRQVQTTVTPIAQNESGLTEFWVPRGYIHVIADARGSNDSDGEWDMLGPVEQGDLREMIEFLAARPWSNGKVGMIGCSYFAMAQLYAAEQKPEGLAAIFPYDALTDLYRDMFFHGGIPNAFPYFWFTHLTYLNLWSGRVRQEQGFRRHFQAVLGGDHELDGPYYRERSSWPNLGDINVPTYLGCDWGFYFQHLRGAFVGWQGIPASVPKRMLIGPEPYPRRPFGQYHGEALRWYDHFLKGLDSGIWNDDPIRLFVQGENVWRGETQWPIERTEWRRLSLSGNELTDQPGSSGSKSYSYDPADQRARHGEPRLIFRSDPMTKPAELTGPMSLHLVASTTARDADWLVTVKDEGVNDAQRTLTRGWLRASHRALDAKLTRQAQPWHPHATTESVPANEPVEYEIEIIPTSNVFLPGHRIRLEISSTENLASDFMWHSRVTPHPGTHEVHTGSGGSSLLIPWIPR
jgi:predicted acyl esterase